MAERSELYDDPELYELAFSYRDVAAEVEADLPVFFGLKKQGRT